MILRRMGEVSAQQTDLLSHFVDCSSPKSVAKICTVVYWLVYSGVPAQNPSMNLALGSSSRRGVAQLLVILDATEA